MNIYTWEPLHSKTRLLKSRIYKIILLYWSFRMVRLIGQFSKYDFWNLWEILDRYRWRKKIEKYFSKTKTFFDEQFRKCFFGFFFEKFVIFLKNLAMGKSRKSHQKMFLRWNQKRSGFSNPFRPPGIVGEVSADTRSSKISIRRIGELRNCSEIASILTFRTSKVGFTGIYYMSMAPSLGFSNGLHLRYQHGKEWKIHEYLITITFFCGGFHMRKTTTSWDSS